MSSVWYTIGPCGGLVMAGHQVPNQQAQVCSFSLQSGFGFGSSGAHAHSSVGARGSEATSTVILRNSRFVRRD